MKAYIGLDIGGSRIKAGVVSASWDVLAGRITSVEATWSQSVFLETLDETITFCLIKARAIDADIRGIGIGICGFVDPRAGVLLGDSKLPHLNNCPIGAHLKQRFGVPVRLDHDVRVITNNELKRGHGRGVKNFCVVAVGTGVGICFVFDGNIYTRAPGGIGHVPINRKKADCRCMVEEDCMRNCHCGARGCLEAYVGRDGLLAEAKRLYGNGSPQRAYLDEQTPNVAMRELANWARAGEALALSVFRTGALVLALGIRGVCNMLNPEIVIVTGGIVSIGDPFRLPLIEALRTIDYLPEPLDQRIRFSEQGDYAGVIGAALLVAEETA